MTKITPGDPGTPRTVGALMSILANFDPDDPIQFMSHDGPDYGALEIGGVWNGGYLEGRMRLMNPL